jgi:hypothetical protein
MPGEAEQQAVGGVVPACVDEVLEGVAKRLAVGIEPLHHPETVSLQQALDLPELSGNALQVGPGFVTADTDEQRVAAAVEIH